MENQTASKGNKYIDYACDGFIRCDKRSKANMLYIERIRQFRQKNNITQAQMAETLGISQQQYFKYEKGINELPIRYLLVICKTYQISADWLLGLSD